MSQPFTEYGMSSEEINALAFHLQPYHGVFKTFWQLGRPVFSMRQKTAAVWFNKDTGEFLRFDINPTFWAEKTVYQKCFVASHECVHIMLNHPKRMKDFANRKIANYAADLVDNHLLVERFGMRRELIDPENVYCWVDKFFKPEEMIPTNGTLEYYYELLDAKDKNGDLPIDGSEGGSGDGDTVETVDGHGSFEDADAGDIIDQLNKALSSEQKNDIKDMLEKHGDPTSGGKEAGKGGGPGQWTFMDVPKIKKRKFETVIKQWSLKAAGFKEKYVEQWIIPNKRHLFLGKDLMLPHAIENDVMSFKKDRILVYFYLDTSGSCHHLAKRFFTAARSLPEDKFDVRLFCFHDYVQETTLDSQQAHLGGGTNFAIIESSIQNIMKTEGRKYPEAVFIITDGYGTNVGPQWPEKWHWFITEDGSQDYIPAVSKIYSLKDYE